MGIFGAIFVIFWCKFDIFKAKFGSFGLFFVVVRVILGQIELLAIWRFWETKWAFHFPFCQF